MTGAPLWRRLLAELLGSAFLAAVVIGSGITAQRLSPGDTGLELAENAAATAAGLYAIILMFGPVSGGHFNPLVSLADAVFGGLTPNEHILRYPILAFYFIAAAVRSLSINTRFRSIPHLYPPSAPVPRITR